MAKMNGSTSPRISRPALILILGALSTISPLSIDMYLSAFPEIASALHTTAARIALSLSSYFLGISIGQLFYGPLLDRYGRKRPLYLGLGIYLAASVGCMFSNSVEMLVVMRLIQALGGCVAQVASLAMVKDFFPVEEGARVLSLLMLVIGVSPLFAPTLGSFVTLAFGWQGVFAVLSTIVIAILIAVRFKLPEGHEPDPTVILRFGPIVRDFASILKTRQFVVYTMAGAFSFAGLFVYVAGSPFLFMENFHVDARTYGIIFAALSVGFIGGGQVNLWLMRRFSAQQILRGALMFQSVVGLALVTVTGLGLLTLPVMIGLLFGSLSCLGLIYPNAASFALEPFERNAGSASALLGFLQLGLGALASAAVGLNTSRSVMTVIAMLATPSWIGLLVLILGGRGIVIKASLRPIPQSVGH